MDKGKVKMNEFTLNFEHMLGWIYILNGKIMHMSQIYGQDNN